MNLLLDVVTSFIGSLAAVAVWFHYDLEDRWRLWKVRQGYKREQAQRRRDDRAWAAHEELLAEERMRDVEHP